MRKQVKRFALAALAGLMLVGCSTQLPNKPPRPTTPTITYATKLTAGQNKAFDATWKAVQEYITKGQVDHAVAAVDVLNGPAGPKGCQSMLFGTKFNPQDQKAVSSAGGYLAYRVAGAKDSGAARVEIATVYFIPLVEPAYRGTYPNGKAYLKVTPQKAAIGMAMRCSGQISKMTGGKASQ